LRVLVVDDERDTVLSLMAILRDEQFDVRGAHDGLTALAKLDEFDADAVIVDIAMPGMTGWDFAREVRNKNAGTRITLVAITGTYVKAPDQMLSRIAGFDFFYTKPLDPNAIVRLLRSFTPRRR
jgi:DNA-binding response OmpR family regulator